MALVGFGVQGVRVIPVELLGGGGMAIAPRAAEALGADTQIDHPPQDRQMAQQPRLIDAMALGDGTPAASAGRTRQRAFDSQHEFPRLGDLGLEDAHIRDIERDRDERVLGHQKPSLPSLASHRAIVHHLDPIRNPYI